VSWRCSSACRQEQPRAGEPVGDPKLVDGDQKDALGLGAPGSDGSAPGSGSASSSRIVGGLVSCSDRPGPATGVAVRARGYAGALSSSARASASKQKRGCRAVWVAPPEPATEEVAMSESTQDRPDEADEKAPKPGEPDTETVAGQPKKAPESKDGEQQSKQDQ
jgi:hypothetical protein